MSVSVHNHVHLRNTSHPLVNIGTEDIALSEFPQGGVYLSFIY